MRCHIPLAAEPGSIQGSCVAPQLGEGAARGGDPELCEEYRRQPLGQRLLGFLRAIVFAGFVQLRGNYRGAAWVSREPALSHDVVLLPGQWCGVPGYP